MLAPRLRPPAPPPRASRPVRVGVGIDTSRYGHYAVFLRDDLQPAAAELAFAESAAGYAQLRQRLNRIAAATRPPCHFVVRLDAAGQYADNLLHFLPSRRWPAPRASPASRSTISCGDPQRNKNYRAALFGTAEVRPARGPRRGPLRAAANDLPRRGPCRRSCASCGRSPAGCKPRSGNAPG